MKFNWKTLFASAATVAMLSAAVPAMAEGDPGPAAYEAALKGKRVALVPMAMGFDLAQGWAAYLKREVEGWGGTFETRDPNWSIEAGAQAITDLISAEPPPNVLVVHSPDLNSYAKLFKKAQEKGIYVILIDNPANFAADAFIGSDWDRLGQLEAEAAVKVCAADPKKEIGLVQGDQVNASSLYQYAGIMKVLDKHPEYKVVAKPDSNWDATTARNVATTMLQQNPDICAIIDFWDGDATGTAAAIRDAGKEGKVALITTGGGEKAADCDKLNSGEYHAVVMTELHKQSGDMNAIIKFLLQSGQPAGTAKTNIYTLERAYTKADLKPDTCWDVKALQAGQ
jgi:ribose transport system substrate-binding protein